MSDELHVNPTQTGTNIRIEEQLRQATRLARKGEFRGLLVLAVRQDGEVHYGSCLTQEDLTILGRKFPEVLAYIAKNLKAAQALLKAKGLKGQ